MPADPGICVQRAEIVKQKSTVQLTKIFPVHDYDLGATLDSGQAFRWTQHGESWVGVIGRHWVKLTLKKDGWVEPGSGESLVAETCEAISDWDWLTDYLQLELNLAEVLKTFPVDEPMNAAVAACRGLRLLRQEPWECLASFILSSTKQIVQIRQIVASLSERFGEPLAVPSGSRSFFSFPAATRVAELSESELRACKMGFRASYLLETARIVASGQFDLSILRKGSVEEARSRLMELPGVGRKIADCVLLFAGGFQSAFPVDVWVMKALRHLYFPRRRPTVRRLHSFAASHFGPNAGYAQQYLFHYVRTCSVALPVTP